MRTRIVGGIEFAVDIVDSEFFAVGKSKSSQGTSRQSIYWTDGQKSSRF
jgi:hypothetical protein